MNRFVRNKPPGNGNNPAPEEEKRGSAGQATHGAYSALRLYRERPLDLRRSDHRFLSEWKKSLIDDLGGAGEISVLQAVLADQCVSLLIILGKMSEWVEANGIMQGGELSPCLKQSFLSYQNSLRLALASIYGDGEKGKGRKKPLNLESYLKSKEDIPNDRENFSKEDDGRSGGDAN